MNKIKACKNKKKLYFFSVIWGKKYALRFVHYVIPSMLTEDNFGYVNNILNVTFLIYTDKETEKILRKEISICPLMNELDFKFDNEFIVKYIGIEGKYYVMDLAAKHALRFCAESKALFFWVFPDVVYSNNAIKSVVEKYTKGAQLVFTPYGFRCHSSIFRAELKKIAAGKTIKEFLLSGIKSTDLVSCAMNSIDESAIKLFSHDYASYRFPSHVYYKVSNNCIVYKGFSLVATLFDTKYLEFKELNFLTIGGTSLESSYLLDTLFKDEDVAFIETSNFYFGVSLESHSPSFEFKEKHLQLMETDNKKFKHPNYFLVSLFAKTKYLSQHNCNGFQKNIFLYSENYEFSTPPKSEFRELEFANSRMKYWLRFQSKHQIITKIIYFFMIENRITGWLLLNSFKAKKKTIIRFCKKYSLLTHRL